MPNAAQTNSSTPHGYDKHRKTQVQKADRNAARVLQFEEAMFNLRSRHLILILTLTYKPEWQHTITLNTIQEHRDRLFNNRRCNQLLQGINGYVWKIEEGQNSGGLHLHAIIFFDGAHRADIYFAQYIGEYWVNVVTQGIGAYWSSNAEKGWHASHGHGIGTGQIDRNDTTKRASLQQNLLYLAKSDQQVLSCKNPHFRFFGTSHLPT